MNKHMNWDEQYLLAKDYTSPSTEKLARLLLKTSINSGEAVDLGCGTGQLTRDLYHRSFKVTGVDGSGAAITIAKKASPHIKYFQADLEKPFPSEITAHTYNLAVCNLVFAFIHKKQIFLKRVKKLLNKGGALVIISPVLEQVTQERTGIAIDNEKTLNLLASLFKKIESYESFGFTVFIAKN